MLFLTSDSRRKRHIGDALIKQTRGDVGWFDDLQNRIDSGISNNHGKREQVILKWILSAEAIGATIVKNEILKVYDKGSTTESD